jgi:hypothetical protein
MSALARNTVRAAMPPIEVTLPGRTAPKLASPNPVRSANQSAVLVIAVPATPTARADAPKAEEIVGSESAFQGSSCI